MNTSSTLHKEKATPEEKLLVFFLLSMVVGVILSCLLESLIISGVFQQWENVAKVPENTKEVIDGSPEQAYIRTTENKILSCSLYNRDECWIPDVDLDSYYTEACDKKHIAFYSALKPPQNIVSCIRINTGGGGYHYDVIYITDQDGNLWRWELVREGSDTPLIIIMMIAGGFVGILISSIIWIIIRLFLIRRSSLEKPLFSKMHIVILAIPWLCFFSFLAFQFLAHH